MTQPQDPNGPEPAESSEGNPPISGDPADLLGVGLPSQADAPTVEDAANAPTASGARSSGSPGSRGPGFVPPTVEELSGLFAQLQILEPLGHGGMGAVYKARQKSLDRLVAVKILPPQVNESPAFAERFTREARALARLNHANIVHVHDFGKVESPQGDLFFITMEYIDGTNLRHLMRSGTMTPSQALAIVAQVCEALQYAHDEGVVHRDIKPENILIDTKGRVKIADFGLAKLARLEGDERDDLTLTHTHAYMGTPKYMAPEQVEGAARVDHRADIYSLGVVFYELLTGELPLGRFDPPSKKVQVDVRLDEVVLRTLEKEPARRYQQASEVKTEVDNVARQGGMQVMPARDAGVPPMSTTGGPIRSTARTPAELLVAAAIMTLLTGIGIVAWWLLTGEFDAARPYQASPKARLQWNMMAIAATHGGYALLIGTAAMLMLGLRARIVSLLMVIVVGLLFPAMFIVNCLHAGVPEWPALIPFWLAMPVALWAVVALLRQDVRQDYEQAAANRQKEVPRLSRLALFTAILVPLVALGWPSWQMVLRKYFDNMPAWEALPWTWKVSGVIGVILASAALFTPLLGAISLALIKRSGGKLYGLRLAFADMMCYPLVLLGAGITFGIATALQTLFAPDRPLPGETPSRGLPFYVGAIPGALVAVIVCFYIARAAWRAVSPTAMQRGTTEQKRREWKPSEDVSGFVCAIISLVMFCLALIIPAILMAVVETRQGEQAAGITFLVGLALAVIFGLLGHHFRMGRFTAAFALVISLGLFGFLFLRTNMDSTPQEQNPTMLPSEPGRRINTSQGQDSQVTPAPVKPQPQPPGPVPPPPDGLEVLGLREGEWEQRENGTVEMTLSARRVLNGRFILGEQRQRNGRVELAIEGYDETSATYRCWLFDTSGKHSANSVQWDPLKQTLWRERHDVTSDIDGTSGWTERLETRFDGPNQLSIRTLMSKPGSSTTGTIEPIIFQRRNPGAVADWSSVLPDKPDPKGPIELKELQRFVGNWASEVRDNLAPNPSWKPTTDSSMRWTLGGRYLLDEVRKANGDLELLGLWTYDAQRKAYLCWYFTDTGDVLEAFMQWDENAKMFAGKGTLAGGASMTLRHHFREDGVWEFQAITTDAEGKVVSDMEGRKRLISK